MATDTKRLALDLSSKKGSKKLAKLLAEGWTIASQVPRSALSWGPKKTDLVLTREK